MFNLRFNIMKTLLKIFFLIAVISLGAGCNKYDEFYSENALEFKKAPIVNPACGLDQERFVTMKDLNLTIHYRIIGKGPIDVVLIPGWTNPLTVYTKQFDYFRDKARCIYIDLPGAGLSDAPTPNTPIAPIQDGPEYTMELMADAVYAVIRKEGLHKFVGVGFSMGPKVLGMFERNYPGMIYKLVVIDGGFDPWPTEEPYRQNFINIRENTYKFMLTWDEAFKTEMEASLIPPGLVGDDAEQLMEWGTYFSQFPTDILANTYYHLGAENANEPVGWLYPKLCFYSNPDPDMDNVNWIYPNNTTYTFPGGGHVIHWIFHEEINPIIWEFIKDRPGRKY
jgi:pimeloyl-ACP methyl ester carboxylesterase